MGLWILEDRLLGENVPGTSLLDDLRAGTLHAHLVVEGDAETKALKRNEKGIVLVPQPSDSPNDPLNWPRRRKIALMFTISYGAGIVGSFGPIIGVGLVQVAENLNTSVDALSKITGDLVLAIGLILLITGPASVIYGRRPIYLIGNALLLASSIWSAAASSLGSLTASRVIGGIGMAPIECLVEATVADIFFVHERGTWIAIWSFALLGGINGVSIVNGFLIQNVSWRVCFWIEAGLYAVLFVFTVFFVPETAYHRQEVSTLAPEDQSEKRAKEDKLDDKGSQIHVETAQSLPPVETRTSYLHSLAPWSRHRFSHEPMLQIALRPFVLLCSPVVAWGTLIYGTTTGWLVALSVSVSLLFSSPQFGYNFGAGSVGLIAGVGPLITTFFGNLIAGPLSDWSVAYLSRRNNGVYEPEFRLVLIIPLFVFTSMGWFGWAISADRLDPWIAPTIFDALINFGQAVGNIAIISYVVDAHSRYAPETFAGINAMKNIWTFALTYFVVPWLTGQGVLRTFCVIGGINAFVCLTTIPMYLYGKRARSWVHRTPWMLT